MKRRLGLENLGMRSGFFLGLIPGCVFLVSMFLRASYGCAWDVERRRRRERLGTYVVLFDAPIQWP